MILQAEAVENNWATLEPMPTTLSGLGVAVVNGKLYVIGSGVTYEYNIAADSWNTKTSMPTSRSSFGVAVIDNQIYVIGGGSAVTEVYYPETDTWETKTSMDIARSGMSASVVNEKIYLVGGNEIESPYDEISVTEVYDPLTDTWATLKQIPIAVTGHVSAVVGTKIYIIGGAVGRNITQIYDTETDTWNTGATMPTGVDSAGTGVLEVNETKRIYVVGGKQNLDAVNLTQIYDPTTDTWTLGTPMPTARYSFGVAVLNNTLYAIGGREGWFGAPISAANEQYTPTYGDIPEFQAWIILPVLASVAAAAVHYKKKLAKKQNWL
ncbi:MAG: hypothetical protein WC325_08970 [Candidatus Bathyarchaeia archaeon]